MPRQTVPSHRSAALRWVGPVLVLGAVAIGAWGVIGRPLVSAKGDGGVTSLASIGGPFALTDQDGQAVTDKTYAGKTLMVMFGYTNCPDVCPTGLASMSVILDGLGPDADRVQGLFITVDPARDTTAVLKDYMANFNPHIAALTGTAGQIAQAAASYKVTYRKVSTDGTPLPPDAQPADYGMDHNAAIFLMDPAGRLKSTINPFEPPTTAEGKVRHALGLPVAAD
ncbi:SCO family protein [Nitrospirillum sp. BR 11163]|uniref:SCO family protein n=1 Tax=Nitrospirillum sp. BR 11163 TaxID=3104323 RepID=UPI002AFE227D|nr:SCO family protein [Nitrospirillum sp. BR 11163]MEA1675191.1 SCO family protein [Nitrospirillum sp. BR 11163]